MPSLRLNTTFEVFRGIRAFFDLRCGFTRGATPDDQQKAQARELESARERIRKQRRWLDDKNQRIELLEHKADETRKANRKQEDRKRDGSAAKLSNAGRSAERLSTRKGQRSPWSVSESEAGMMPDFLIIGTQKGGTTYLYNLLVRHSHIEPATTQEVHFFDSNRFRRGTDWYRSNFPHPQRRNGRRIITGESSPYYIYHPHAAERAAKIVRRAKLIALLRNPVDRAYSDYQQRLRLENETLGFEEAIDAEEDRITGEHQKLISDKGYFSRAHRRYSYLARGVYVDQLEQWHRYFDEDQLLVLKSEDFFERPREILNVVLEFLDLSAQDIGLSAGTNEGGYKSAVPPDIRRRLEGYFEPHNQRLYDYLGRDFGW